MANICGTTSAVPTSRATLGDLLAFFSSVAIAFWAMWTMLGAAFNSDCLQIALTLMLWIAAVGAARDALCSAMRWPSGRPSRSTPRANEQRAAPITSTAVPPTTTSMRRQQLAATVIMSLLSLGPGGSASAGGFIGEVRGGVLAHNGTDWNEDPRGENGLDGNLEILFAPAWPFLGGAIRPALGGTVSVGGRTNLVYADLRYEHETPDGLFFGFGLGAAVHDGPLDDRHDRKALGSRLLFHVPLELGWRWDRHQSVSLYFEHVSNAGLADENEGMDNLGLRYGYRF
jgi:lipid A 3-O-deacylase